MGIRVTWTDESRSVMIWHFEPDWTWEEWHEATQLAVRLRKASPSQPQVAVILDVRPTRVLPKNPLQHGRKAIEYLDPRDVIILVGGTFLRFLASTFRELYPAFGQRFYVVDSSEKAMQLAAQLRGSTRVG